MFQLVAIDLPSMATGIVEPLRAVVPLQIQQSETGSVGLLRMLLACQQMLDKAEYFWPDISGPAE